MSHDRSKHGNHGNNQNSDTPLTNGIAPEAITKSHSAQFMDGTAQLEPGMAQSSLQASPALYSNSVPRKMHHRIHDNGNDIADNYYSGSHDHRQTTNVIGPSASIPEYLGSARPSRIDMYLEEADGAGMSRQYDVTVDESDRRKKPVPRQQNVKLLDYKPFSDESNELGEVGGEMERGEGDTSMTLSQQDFVSDLDAKITAMIRTKKVSEGSGRTPRVTAIPLTKESMKEVMNMTPKQQKRSSRSETKRLARNSVHGVPWGVDTPTEKHDDGTREMDTEIKKKVEKKRRKLVKADSVQLVGFRRKDDVAMTPLNRGAEGGIRESSSQTFSLNPAMPPNSRVKDTISTSSSFEFRSAFSPTHSSRARHRPLSPTQELVAHMMSEPGGQSPSVVLNSEVANEREGTAEVTVVTSMFDQEEGRTVYRQNLEHTHLADVAVFGKHFDPSQLTQERMGANVGDLSSVGLEPSAVSPSKKKGEMRGRRQESERNDASPLSSGNSRQEKRGGWNSRSKSASVSPMRKKGEREKMWRTGGGSSIKSHDSSGSERDKLSSWEVEISPHESRHSAILSTPSRYRMARVARTIQEPADTNDVFSDELGDENMPNIYGTNPRKALSSSREASGRGVKEATPDSGTSDEEKPKKRRSIGFALGRKLSNSMKELFNTKDKKSPTTRTTWHFETGDLYPAPSEPQLSILTEEERRAILEETEVIPRTHSTEIMSSSRSAQFANSSSRSSSSQNRRNPLAHLFTPPTSGVTMSTSNPGLSTDSKLQAAPTGLYEERSVDGYTERSVDVPSSKQRRKSGSSGDDYETASESEEGYVKSAVNIITVPTDSNEVLREAGYFVEGERQTGKTGQTGLPTIEERTPPSNDASQYQMPPSEDAPIVKTLDGVISKKSAKDTDDGKKSKKTKITSRDKEPSSKKDDTKKPMFSRFSKQRTNVQRKSPSPRSMSPSSGSSNSRQSSGRFSPSRKLSNASSTGSGTKTQPPNVDSARRSSKTSLGSSSPSGSFRGGQISPLARGGRGSPRGSFRGGATSPRGSGRGSTTLSGLNVSRGTTSPKPGGHSSPRGSFNSGSVLLGSPRSPGGSMRGQKSSPSGGRGSPVIKTPSPKSSVQLRHPPQPTGRLSPAGKMGSSKVSKRRLSEPVSPAGTSLDAPQQSASKKRLSTASVAGRPKPVPARQAPPPPTQPQQKPAVPLSHSRTSSQTSTVTPTSNTSSTSSPRQRKKGMSLSESPLTPRSNRLKVPSEMSESGAKEVKTEPDDIGRLLATVGEKLAPLSASPEPNPLDVQTEFEIPPRADAAVFSPPPGGEEKVPSYSLSSSGELLIEGQPSVVPGDVAVTPADTPVPVQRGVRPKNVISALIGGRKKSSTTSTKPSNNSKSAGSLRKNKSSFSSSAEAGNSSVRTSARKNSLSFFSFPKSSAAASKGASQKAGASSVQRVPSLRGSRSGEVGTGRSQSTIVVPTIRVSEARKSIRKASTTSSVGSSSSRVRSSRGGAMGSQSSLVRSSIRVSSKLKKNNPMSPEHRRVSSLTRMKPGDRPPSRGSMHSLPRHSTTARPSSVRRPVRVAPVAPGRSSIHKTSAGAETLNRTQPSLNSPERRRQSVMTRSMRKPSTVRPQAQGLSSGNSLGRNVGTRSMRMSSSRKVSSLGTMPRSSVVSKVGTAPVAGGNLQMTPTRKSMRKPSNVREVYDVFDQISADAKGNLLTSSDHRRIVRPKFRQKASATHLRMLQERSDITSDMLTGSDSDDVMSGLDPNTYSTYMAKKNLAPSAVAGLAMKLDLTTVKLRKTGISDKMLMDRSTDITKDLPNLAVGAEYDTKHTTLLLQIKGRRQVHTRLVEPSVTSMNSGDVYICVSGKFLYHWVGKSANVIEKARGSDVVMRIVHKKELGCQATAPVLIKEEVRESGSAKIEKFWQLLGGKKGVKSSESVPNDDLYEKSVNMVTTVMHLEGSDDAAHFTAIHESSNHMLKIAILDTKKILLLDFHSEVYVWVGKMSPAKLRKKAIELAKKHFNAGCKPPVFTHQGAGGSTVIRSSGRYRAKVSSTHNPRNSTLNRSGRRVSRARKESGASTARPSWAMFNRLNEGSEHILFREKFSDWPEQGRIIKMKGHSTTPVMPCGPVELVPADVEKMLRTIPKFEGLRLDGDNVHRGQGNYKVSRSTFACNRVHPNKCTKWVIKDNDNVVVPESDHGLFYVQEAYVIRWSYRITVVKELEGLTPGEGMFARDRKRQKEREEKDREVKDAQTSKIARGNDSSDTESEEEEQDEESRRTLESGGRDKVAYFFWQGDDATLNEKGASALLTVELDKERGPQVRVVQNKEPPAFINLFGGGMVILNGRSETLSFKSPARPIRLFFVRGQMRSEACLVEIDPEHWPMAKFFRSRGCYVIYDNPSNKIYLWKGCKITASLRKVSHTSARLLKRRLKADLVMVEEGQEPKDLSSLIGDKNAYDSLLNGTRLIDYTPRLFELSSTTGEFIASEVLYNARGSDIEAAPFIQDDIYCASQPAIFLVDAYRVVYIWLGWWQQERRDWSIMRETNITTGSAHARWLRDKKLALQTAQLYAKASTDSRKHQPKTYMIHAGTEPDEFINLFPFWKPNAKVQELQCKGRKPIPQRVDVDEELLKYSRTQFSLKELQKRPLPEGVDPSQLETYITDEEFQTVFRISREQFKKFPAWKQTEIKKRHGLF